MKIRYCPRCGSKTLRVCGIGVAPVVLDDNEMECRECGWRGDAATQNEVLSEMPVHLRRPRLGK